MHPPLFPLLDAKRWESFLKRALQIDEDTLLYCNRLLSEQLVPVYKGPEIGHFLGVSPKIVAYMAANPEKFYQTFEIKKKNGGVRTILAPRVFLKQTQRYILDCILSVVDCRLSSSVTGFRKGMSVRDGALPHLNAEYLWSIDIKDFFPTIRLSQVVEVFSVLGYNDRSAAFMGALCTHAGVLPQGAPTSPALANHVLREIDSEIANLCKKYKITYTRYADDLSFSGAEPFDPVLMNDIKTVLKEGGFTINPNKERLIGPASRKTVTGSVVSSKITIPREIRRKVRSMFHKAKCDPYAFTNRISELSGYVGWFSTYDLPEVDGMRMIVNFVREANRAHG